MKQRTKKPTTLHEEPASLLDHRPNVANEPIIQAPQPIPPFLRRHAFSLMAAAFCMAICFWTISEGTGTILIHHGFDAFYDSQADSLLHGHWDVAKEAIMGEDFAFEGKHYGYFGFTPALPRILLNRLFPSMYGRWTRVFMLLCIASVIGALLAFMDLFKVRSNPFLLMVAVLGSTLLFLCSHGIVYHEAIMTGATLALWAYLFFGYYLRQPRLAFLAAACTLSFLSFFARLTAGAGPLLLASFLCLALLVRALPPVRIRQAETLLDWLKFPSPPAALKHATLLAVCLAATVGTYVSVNYEKFGTWLNPAPYQYHVQYTAERLANIDGSINHLSNIPFDVSAYFGPRSVGLERSFPWFKLVNERPKPGSAAKMDLVEGYSSLPSAMPALTILAILGLVFAATKLSLRIALPAAAAAFAAGCLILPNACVTFRYLHDFYPFLVISAILGAGAVQAIASKPLRLAAKAVIALAGLWSIVACFALTLRWQREDFWPEPIPQAALQRMRRSVDAFMPFGIPEPIRYTIGDKVHPIRAGQLLNVVDPAATYRYDGQRWNYVDGVPLHRFRLLVKFPYGKPNTQMALWFAGRAGACDAIFIVYSNPTQVAFCSDHWGGGVACGAAMDIQPDREYHVQIDADRLNSELTLQLEGRTILTAPMPFHVWNASEVLLGRSLAPLAHGGPFEGEIKKDH